MEYKNSATGAEDPENKRRPKSWPYTSVEGAKSITGTQKERTRIEGGHCEKQLSDARRIKRNPNLFRLTLYDTSLRTQHTES